MTFISLANILKVNRVLVELINLIKKSIDKKNNHLNALGWRVFKLLGTKCLWSFMEEMAKDHDGMLKIYNIFTLKCSATSKKIVVDDVP